MREGDEVADFTATDQDGESLSLSGLLRQGPVALFFYPKAMTPG
jgi:peroxiredoxin Q/BCP